MLEESAFTPEQLLGYEKFWDIISVEKTLISSAERKGKAEGRIAEKLEIARNMKSANIPVESIMQFTNLSKEEIEKL